MLTHLDIQWMIKATVFYYGSFNSDILHQHQPFIWLPLISYHYCMLVAWSVELVINCFVPLNKAKVSFGASVCWFLYLLLYSYCYCSYLCSIQSWGLHHHDHHMTPTWLGQYRKLPTFISYSVLIEKSSLISNIYQYHKNCFMDCLVCPPLTVIKLQHPPTFIILDHSSLQINAQCCSCGCSCNVVVVAAVVVVVVTRCVWLQAAVCSVYYGWLQLDWAGSCCPASHYSIH